MRIIPAIDIIEGKCVRLTRGDYATKKIYNEKPLEVAKQFEDAGIEFLHLVDLDGAKSKQIVNHKILYEIASRTGLKIDFGGGLKSDEDLRIAFENGAAQVTGGSIAVIQPEIFENWIKKFGSDRIILGADALKGKIAINGWQEDSDMEILPFINQYTQKGIKYIICTDISRDGMLEGPAVQLYSEILSRNNDISLIASGGISEMEDIYRLQETGCEGAIIGKAIYEGRISFDDLKKYIIANGKKL
ncbi:MAG TPA: 1-(5-phosphoribosyl)-5-[(5-phosphoribosylamino)methylideneamino]imidazole-4-carboxamide isomerase [Salinimicrobium sp.]|nr:1-(5-phosphoribosyl)-5-[(5-phosphoribosylamino)methylideneamino]imidazole-4-carboxamide isomerase [Salinimicrobium sp.]